MLLYGKLMVDGSKLADLAFRCIPHNHVGFTDVLVLATLNLLRSSGFSTLQVAECPRVFDPLTQSVDKCLLFLSLNLDFRYVNLLPDKKTSHLFISKAKCSLVITNGPVQKKKV